jgi:hypothetical protein
MFLSEENVTKNPSNGFLQGLLMGGAGALIGSKLNKKNPLKGALLGGGVGMTGNGLLSMFQGSQLINNAQKQMMNEYIRNQQQKLPVPMGGF